MLPKFIVLLTLSDIFLSVGAEQLTIVFCGSFNPPHKGHHNMTVVARKKMQNLTSPEGSKLYDPIHIYISPVHSAYIKNNLPLGYGFERLEMLKMYFEEKHKEYVKKFELEQPTPMKTYDYLKHLRDKEHIQGKIMLLLGEDSFLGIEHWHEGVKIIQEFGVIVITRPDSNKEDKLESLVKKYITEKDMGNIVIINDTTYGKVSSSKIRTAIRTLDSPILLFDEILTARQILKDSLSDKVAECIREKELYIKPEGNQQPVTLVYVSNIVNTADVITRMIEAGKTRLESMKQDGTGPSFYNVDKAFLFSNPDIMPTLESRVGLTYTNIPKSSLLFAPPGEMEKEMKTLKEKDVTHGASDYSLKRKIMVLCDRSTLKWMAGKKDGGKYQEVFNSEFFLYVTPEERKALKYTIENEQDIKGLKVYW